MITHTSTTGLIWQWDNVARTYVVIGYDPYKDYDLHMDIGL